MPRPELPAVAESLWRANCVKFGHVKLSGGSESDIYFNLRVLKSFNNYKTTIVDVYERLTDGLEFDFIADIPQAVTPYVSSLCDRLGIGQITPRTETKDHGIKTHIEGCYKAGQKILVVDDSITEGGSLSRNIIILRDGELVVNEALVLIDRQRGGQERLKQMGVNLIYFCTITELLDYYITKGRLDRAQHQIALKEKKAILNHL